MTQDINTTITTALSVKGLSAYALNSHSDYIETAVDALTEREHQITDALLDVAERLGHYTREEVKAELRRSVPGLNFRPDAPAPAATPAEEFVAYLEDALKQEVAAGTVAPEVRVQEWTPESAPEDESKGGKKARKEQAKRELEERLTRLEHTVNSLATLARRHLDASI